jgi:predicted TIM-barrel fold metal-dependent hydrolase
MDPDAIDRVVRKYAGELALDPATPRTRCALPSSLRRLRTAPNFEDVQKAAGHRDPRKRPGMLGLRFYTDERHPLSWFTDGTLDWPWPDGEHAQVPVALGAAMFLPTVGKIAERHPGLKLIVDHMGVPRASKGEAAYRFQPELLALARYPNVAVKATGQAGYAEDEYPFRSLHPHLHRCFDAFGPERMFWGTGITRMPCSWRQCVTLFTEELPWLKGRDLELVMDEAVCHWIGWSLPVAGRR